METCQQKLWAIRLVKLMLKQIRLRWRGILLRWTCLYPGFAERGKLVSITHGGPWIRRRLPMRYMHVHGALKKVKNPKNITFPLVLEPNFNSHRIPSLLEEIGHQSLTKYRLSPSKRIHRFAVLGCCSRTSSVPGHVGSPKSRWWFSASCPRY